MQGDGNALCVAVRESRPGRATSSSGALPGSSSVSINTTYQVGSALGLAAMTAIATSQGAAELGNLPRLTDGFQAAFIGAGAVLTLVLMRRPKPGAPVQTPSATDSVPI
jgi:hypothetical protein